MEKGTITNIGKYREKNEDRVTFIEGKTGFFAAVCDGMGGRSGGEVASNECISFFEKEYKKMDYQEEKMDIKEWLYKVSLKCNEHIFSMTKENSDLIGMGTTLIALIKYNDNMYFVNVGDSRIYAFGKNYISQLSDDQTFVAALLRAGYIDEAQAKVHPRRSTLLSAIGSSSNDELIVQIEQLKKEKNFILCSDGLYNMLDNEEILKTLKQNTTTEDKLEILVEKANNNGGHDNIAIVILEDVL